jgi:hypothetical protein
MRPSTIVMAGPGFECPSDVGFVEWNYKIETFSTSTADQALAKCIRLRRLIRSLQHSQPERLQRLIQFLRIDTVTVMDNESVSFIIAHAFSKLLKRPLGRRMLSNVKVKDAPRVEFHDHEHVDQPKRCCHNDKEVGGDDGLRVIAHGEAKLLINRAAENNSMMHVIDEHLLDLAANRIRTLSQVTN